MRDITFEAGPRIKKYFSESNVQRKVYLLLSYEGHNVKGRTKYQKVLSFPFYVIHILISMPTCFPCFGYLFKPSLTSMLFLHTFLYLPYLSSHSAHFTCATFHEIDLPRLQSHLGIYVCLNVTLPFFLGAFHALIP
jgi:hypothetical protein